jgi:membrane fusion protein, multidrug efflux system
MQIIPGQALQHTYRRRSAQLQPNGHPLFVGPSQSQWLRWIVLLSLGSLSMMTACSGGKGTQTSQVAPAPAVVVSTLQPQTVPIYSEYVGETEAVNVVEIHSQVQGFLQQIAFKEGSIVQKGQLLFVIDPRPYQATLQEAKATLEVQQETVNNAQKIVDRYTPLTQQHAVSQQQLDSAVATAKENQAQVQSAQAQVAAAQLNVNYTRISAPMAGSIGTSQVKVGDLIQSGSTLLDTIYNITPMYVTFAISQSDYLSYTNRRRQQPKQAHPIQLILGDGSVYGHSGTVDMVAPTVSTTTGTLSIRATFPNPESILKPGLFARMRFVARDAVNALLVPQGAIQQLQGTQSVFVVGADNKVQQRTVTTGAMVANLEIVSSGLQPGDRVVVEGVQKVQPGMTVQAQEAPAQTVPTGGEGQAGSKTPTSPLPSPASSSEGSAAMKPKEN